jgi:hypothetical protein
VSTRASKSQKRFDHEAELIGKIREECATYVALTLELGREAENLQNQNERIMFIESEPYERVRYAYQYIMMFCTDTVIRKEVKKFSTLDDARFKIISNVLTNSDTPLPETWHDQSDYKNANTKFQDNREIFYKKIRERFEHHTRDNK